MREGLSLKTPLDIKRLTTEYCEPMYLTTDETQEEKRQLE